MVGWVRGGRGIGKQHRVGRQVGPGGHFLDAFDFPVRHHLVGGILAKLGNQPFAHIAPQPGGDTVRCFGKLNHSFLGFAELNRPQPLHRRGVRTEKADMAQVVAVRYRIVRMAGRPKGGGYLLVTSGADGLGKTIIHLGELGRQAAAVGRQLRHPAVGRGVHGRMADDNRRFMQLRVVHFGSALYVGIRDVPPAAIGTDALATSKNLKHKKSPSLVLSE